MPAIEPYKLGKLSLAILENFVKSSLGENFVEELKDSYSTTETVAKALRNAEKRFITEFPDQEISNALVSLPLYDRPSLNKAAQQFYVHPTDQEFQKALEKTLSRDLPNTRLESINSSVRLYVQILIEELALADTKFRDNIVTLAALRSDQPKDRVKDTAEMLSQKELAETLINVQNLLAQIQISQDNRKNSLPKPTIFGVENDFGINPELCFVLMPFGPSWSRKLFDNHITKACKNQGLKSLRADDIYSVRGIMQDVWGYINQARLVIADLTARNPNVFYEVGIAHTLGKEVILITQTMDDVPFDLRAIRCIVYSLELDGPQKLEKDLARTISSILG